MTIHSKNELPVITNVSRRGILKGMVASGGLVLAAQFPALAAPRFYPTGAEGMPNKTVSDPHVFVSIAPDGIVSIVAERAEMGNGAARTSLPMIVADELMPTGRKCASSNRRAMRRNTATRIPTAPQRAPLYPSRCGSCGASARQMLETALPNAGASTFRGGGAANHEVVHRGTGRKLGYGALAEDAAALPTPAARQSKAEG